MADMPQVNPRNMAEKTSALIGTHAKIHTGMQERARQRQAALDERNRELNAQAKLEGKTP